MFFIVDFSSEGKIFRIVFFFALWFSCVCSSGSINCVNCELNRAFV